MENVLVWLLFGIMLGLIGGFMRVKITPAGFVESISYSVAGAVFGGVLGQLVVGSDPAGYFSPLIFMIVGSLTILLLPKEMLGQ